MFPSNTENNPRENASAITLRSGKIMGEVEKKIVKEKDEEIEKPARSEDKIERTNKSEVDKDLKEKEKKIPSHGCGKIPFPNALVKKNLEKQFS
jgi:hypothetical protein